MKKWLKNAKGLTLVELLAVIVILGIIAAIAIPTMSASIKNSKVRSDFATYDMIVDAATRWSMDEQAKGNTGATTTDATGSPSVGKLVTDGYLTEYKDIAQSNSAIKFQKFKVEVDTTTGKITVKLFDGTQEIKKVDDTLTKS